jgi:gluconolactonase
MSRISWTRKISAVAGAFAVIASASAQQAATDATVTPAIAGVVAAGTKIELIKDGFNGTEGPLPLPDGSVIFSETPANRITHIAADGTTSPFLENTNGSNGLAFAKNGDLYSVQVQDPKVGIVYPASHAKVLADQYEGLPFSRPNDIVLDKKGGVYFTDSGNGTVKPDRPTAKPAVYYITPAGVLKRIAADIERPNGIQLSPNEKILYVANTLGEYVFAYDIKSDGSLGKRRNFAKLAGWQKTDTGYSSGADGLAIDAKGDLYVASNVGIEVFNSKGKALGSIALPKKPQNLALAGPDKRTLYIVGRGSAYKIALLTPGYTGRAK